MTLWQLDRGINDLMEKAELGEATQEEIQFLKNVHADLGETLERINTPANAEVT